MLCFDIFLIIYNTSCLLTRLFWEMVTHLDIMFSHKRVQNREKATSSS